MTILVCITKTPDTTAPVRFSADNKEYNPAGVAYILNPYDEWYSLVCALELTEKHGGAVTVINVGPADNETLIRKALAIGAADAIRIDANPSSALFVAKQISGYAKDKGYDAIFCGKETIDYNGAEVGPMIAELLDLPFLSFANHLELDGRKAKVSRDIEGGTEVVEVELPFVLSAAKDLAEQRIPNMMGIMKAKQKPLQVIPPAPFEDKAVIAVYETPPAKSSVRLIDPENMDELVRLLHEEAKII
ncbi:MAG: electron transfer flavoprotein subunit beta/FixA family protein [Saprospirales bacterium]|nr:electron transfer flavoprotein subunit beta/FixA family protein [Saprospirales bacterium]